MKLGTLVIIAAAVGAAAGRAIGAPFPGLGENPYLDLIAHHDPGIHAAIRVWYHAAPAAAVILAGNLCLAVWRVWFQPLVRIVRRGRLPKWPTSPEDDKPSLVVGELHHPTAPRPSERPSWLVVPEKGLYTGVLVVGAVGTGKTTACMYPFARQLLHWRADDPNRRAGALVLEVKGDFCHQVRSILGDAGRADDYLEIGLGGSWQWNPLDDPLLDSYSLAYGVASLINQLFGKSREPFWQQAYTNLVRWIIELHRLLPGRWVTLRDIYRCTVDAELFADKIGEAKTMADRVCPQRAVIANTDLAEHKEALGGWAWKPVPGTASAACRLDAALRKRGSPNGRSSSRPKRTEPARVASSANRSRPSSVGTGRTGWRWTRSSAPRSSKESACSSPCSTSRTWPGCSVRRRPTPGSRMKPDRTGTMPPSRPCRGSAAGCPRSPI
ncbi:MAG: hypothetical protein OXI76_17270 [Gemmatimonadota bacterium]|nr:hypothetical protein [Gemmatimonadota bacterium]